MRSTPASCSATSSRRQRRAGSAGPSGARGDRVGQGQGPLGDSWRPSTSRPSRVATPRPSARAAWKAAMVRRAVSSSSWLGAKIRFAASPWLGWMRVFPSNPSLRPCRRSSSKPVVSRTSLDTPSSTTTPAARAPRTASDRAVRIGARRGTGSVPSSLATSFVPRTKTVNRGEADSISAQSRIARGVSIIAHSAVRSGAPAASMAAASDRTSPPSRPWGRRCRLDRQRRPRRDPPRATANPPR
jgi:hypothetical protein